MIYQMPDGYFIAARKIGNKLIELVVELYSALFFQFQKRELDEQFSDRSNHKLFINRSFETGGIRGNTVIPFQNNFVAECDQNISVKLFLFRQFGKIFVNFDGGL